MPDTTAPRQAANRPHRAEKRSSWPPLEPPRQPCHRSVARSVPRRVAELRQDLRRLQPISREFAGAALFRRAGRTTIRLLRRGGHASASFSTLGAHGPPSPGTQHDHLDRRPTMTPASSPRPTATSAHPRSGRRCRCRGPAIVRKGTVGCSHSTQTPYHDAGRRSRQVRKRLAPAGKSLRSPPTIGATTLTALFRCSYEHQYDAGQNRAIVRFPHDSAAARLPGENRERTRSG